MDRVLSMFLADEAQTETLGRTLAETISAPALIFLRGDLGAGKTTFSRGFIQASGHRGPVKSPTYTLIEPYVIELKKIYHLDLYRLSDPGELEYLGLEDLLAERAIVLVEWPERGSAYLPDADLEITLQHRAQGRDATLLAHTGASETWLAYVTTHFPQKSHPQD